MKKAIQLVILIALVGAIIYFAVPVTCDSGKSEPRIMCMFDRLEDKADERMDQVIDRTFEDAPDNPASN